MKFWRPTRDWQVFHWGKFKEMKSITYLAGKSVPFSCHKWDNLSWVGERHGCVSWGNCTACCNKGKGESEPCRHLETYQENAEIQQLNAVRLFLISIKPPITMAQCSQFCSIFPIILFLWESFPIMPINLWTNLWLICLNGLNQTEQLCKKSGTKAQSWHKSNCSVFQTISLWNHETV